MKKIDWSDKEVLLLLVSFAVIFVFWGLGKNALIDWDESIYAGVAREMFEGGDWMTPHWNRDVFFEKPPLYFWLTAITFKFFGISEFSARFWPALFGVLGVLAVYFLGRRLFDRQTGVFSALILSTTIHWVFQSRNATLDVPVATLIAWALYFFWRAWSEQHLGLWVIFGSLIGLAFMVKGPVAAIPILVAAAFAVVDIVSGNHDFKPYRLTVAGLVAIFFFLLFTLPWHLLMFWRHGLEFIREYFFYHIILRARTGIEHHEHDFLWYLTVVRHWARLWFAAFLVALFGFLIITFSRLKEREMRQILFLFVWLVLTFLVFSSSVSKIQWYIIPIYPPLALLVGRFLAILSDWLSFIFPRASSLVLFSIFAVGLGGLLSSREQWDPPDYNRDVAQVSKEAERVLGSEDELLVANLAPGPPIFYSSRKVQTIGFWGLFKKAEDGERMFALSPKELLRNFRNDGVASGIEVFAEQGGVVLYGRR